MRTNLVRWSVVLLLLAGCGPSEKEPAEPRTLSTKGGLIELRFPADWYENPKDHPFDLQCFSPDQRMNTGLFVYQKADLAADFTPRRVLETHVEDIRGKRERFEVLEPEASRDGNGLQLTTAVYAAEKGNSRNLYRFTLIEFEEDPDVFAVALQVCVPSEWSRAEPILDEIVRSARRREG